MYIYVHVRRISQENMKLVRVCVFFFKFVRVDTVCRVIYAVLFSSFRHSSLAIGLAPS